MVPRMASQINVFVNNPLFDPDTVRRSSVSAAALAKWVRAMSMYQDAKKVRGSCWSLRFQNPGFKDQMAE